MVMSGNDCVGIYTSIFNSFLISHPSTTVTAPAAVYAGRRAWDMGMNGLKLKVYHNFRIDGKGKGHGGFRKFYANNVSKTLPESVGVCKVLAAGR
jgi:hypothetical protein